MNFNPLILANVTPYSVGLSVNDQSGSYPFSLGPCLTRNSSIPFVDTTARWVAAPQAPESGVLSGNSNILMLRFSQGDGGAWLYDRVYTSLALPGFGGTHGPQPQGAPLYMWIFTGFLLFSQNGKAQIDNGGTLPPAPGWRVLHAAA